MQTMELITFISLVIGIAASACAVYFGVRNNRRANKTDDAEEGKKDGVILTEIGYIKSGVDDIKRKQETQDKQHIEVITRLTAVEESSKQAHHRIDEIQDKISH